MGVARERILLVPPGSTGGRPAVDPTRSRRGCERPTGSAIGPYFVYPAITYPHKNHLTLVRAFARVAATDPEPLLVLPGGAAQAEVAAAGRDRRASGSPSAVRAARVASRAATSTC